MYLKALSMQGFKSFPDKTVLTFNRDITAIVGPNGSGKSNISDAILWVMGEQSTKTLRGGKMQDVIFGGTEKRGAMGFAQVSLVIDNSSGIFNNESDEITITRKYYRSGDSEYYINRESVRLRDVNELLMDTGLGRNGYSIIGQGRIGEIVSGKSQERREVLEEAAGISRYRYRKEEAERRLSRTDENLLRLSDKIDELELQVGPLQKQAETAKQYLALRDKLREAEVSLWLHNLDAVRGLYAEINRDYETAKNKMGAMKRELDALYARSEELARRMREKDIELENARLELSRAEASAAECESAAAVLRANLQNSAEHAVKMREEMSEQAERERGVAGQIEARQERIDEIDSRIKSLSEAEARSRNVIEGCKMRIANREAEEASLNDALTKQIIEIRSANSRISMLTEMEKDYEGFGKSVKAVMREARQGSLRGIRGTVADIIKVDERCALAIETALGGAIQNIVVDTQQDGRAAIELLKRRDGGRATFLPLDTIRGGRYGDVPPESDGCLGLAADLVSFAPEYRAAVENLLGRTLVAETLGDAMAISRRQGGRVRIVTLDGQLVNAGGSMTGGSVGRGSGILSRANELEKLSGSQNALTRARDDLQAKAEELKRELSAARQELGVAEEGLRGVQNEQSSLMAERRATESAAAELEALRLGMAQDHDSRLAAVKAMERGAEDFRREIAAKEAELAAANRGIGALKTKISEITAKKLEAEGGRTRTDREAQDKNADILDMERTCARCEQKKIAAEMEEKQILDKLWDNYELSHSSAQEIRRPVENTARAAREVAELRRGISALGNPNLGSIDEYARVSERYEFLRSQRDDVIKARRELSGIISDMTAEMTAIFTREFAAINQSFGETFRELFGGGQAELVLEDETDVLNCGVDIRVQPPGKALSTLSLLSGGEMAFVAIALYFAIIKVKPTPFCVVDEIEAALDEVNVVRYAQYMRRIAGKTQFIVITHRRGSMEEADELYGVTMQEKGVSRVIELDLVEAEKHIGEDN